MFIFFLLKVTLLWVFFSFCSLKNVFWFFFNLFFFIISSTTAIYLDSNASLYKKNTNTTYFFFFFASHEHFSLATAIFHVHKCFYCFKTTRLNRIVWSNRRYLLLLNLSMLLFVALSYQLKLQCFIPITYQLIH